jgi:RimJ/RimL family protein N-acetyltransferase
MPVLPEPLTLRDGVVVLRDWREDDAPSLEPVCGDWDVCQFTSVPWTYTPSDARAWVRHIHDRRSSGSGLALAITREGDDVVLGSVNLVRFSDDGREAALGYWLVPAARGHGLAVTAARMLCSWGFEQLRLQRVELAVLPKNLASTASPSGSGRCAKACGATAMRPTAARGTWSSTRCGPSLAEATRSLPVGTLIVKSRAPTLIRLKVLHSSRSDAVS